jgi:hypothetical protein
MQRGVIETWDERWGKGWVICGETIFFPRIALCNNAATPKACLRYQRHGGAHGMSGIVA